MSKSESGSASPPPTRILRSQATPKKRGRGSKSPIKRRRLSVDTPIKKEEGVQLTKCDRSVCDSNNVQCCLNITENIARGPSYAYRGTVKLVSCASRLKTENARWVHISEGEHYCSQCGDHVTKGGGCWYTRFTDWRTSWIKSCRRDPTFRTFVGEELLAYYFRCNSCSKWRHTPSTTECDHNFEANFHCKQYMNSLTDEPLALDEDCCDLHKEDVRAIAVGPSWLESLAVPGLLRNTPANVFLNDEYFNDEVGMSHTQSFEVPERDPQVIELMQPFYVPTETGKGLCLRPDVMEYDEIIHFPQYTTEQSMYLGLRNLAVTLWNFNPKVWLTPLNASHYILCRGLVRIHLVNEMERIIQFLTLRGVINHGVLPKPSPFNVFDHIKMEKIKKLRVVIIGGGISGLCAANQLNRFGVEKMIVLEACAQLGGRCRDDSSLGVSVGCGAQLLTGVINNPVIVMCLQKEVKFRPVTEHCPLIDAKNGKEASKVCDERVDFHFNCVLDAVENWRKTAKQDSGLETQIKTMHNSFLNQSKLKWSDEEDRLMQFQLGNLEFSCGACLEDVSSVHWDQNESFAQFAGDHALLTQGAKPLIDAMVDGVDVRTNHVCGFIEVIDSCEQFKVKKIDYSNCQKPIVITCKNGKRLLADKVLITMPLAVLQLTDVFHPKLPDSKRTAIQQLGAGIIEKVAVKFPAPFWISKSKGADYFGHVPDKKEDRGLFNMFYDFSKDSDPSSPSFVLMSYVCGEAVDIVNENDDEQVVNVFMQTLQKLFPDQTLPEPLGYLVTHWARDPYFGMSYSYIRKGAKGAHYDTMAQDVQQRLYFAGEATNRYFPQTMTGAYLTGFREAAKIVSHATQ